MNSIHRHAADAHEDPDHAHGPHGGGGHDHSRALRGKSRRSLVTALVLIAGYMVAEVAGGILSGSLALLADAGHMLTDAASIGLALLAMHFADRPPSARRTFGYHRLEILAALLNALTLWVIAAWVVVEASHRFRDLPDVDGGLMLSVGAVGLVVNVLAAWISPPVSGAQRQRRRRLPARDGRSAGLGRRRRVGRAGLGPSGGLSPTPS